jgi:integrase
MENLSLFKNNRSGVWFIQYRTADGIRKQASTRCTHKADAVKVLPDFGKFLADGSKRKQMPLSSFVKDFLVYAKTNYAPHTAYLYDKTLAHFIRICGDLSLAKITPKHFDLYKVARLNECVGARLGLDELHRNVSPITVNIELRTLRAAMNTATRWELITKNPFQTLPLIAIPKRTPAFLTVENADQLLGVIKEQWLKNFVIFAINTGMRRGEILSLRWCDVDMTARVARITNTDEFTAKGGEQRIVSLNDAALMVIKRCTRYDNHEFVFSDDEGRRMLKDRITHAFKKAVRAAGLPEGLHLHSTRHSFASLLVGSGTSLFTVSKLLGHSSAKTSEIYSHLLPQHLHSEVEKISIGIGSAPLRN